MTTQPVIASQVARQVLGHNALPFEPGKRMSAYASWFMGDDDQSLVTVVAPGVTSTAGDEVLAYGLAWQEDRDLVLVVPDAMVMQALSRIAWLHTVVRIWTYEGESIRPVPSLSRIDVLTRLSSLPGRSSKQATLKPGHETWLDGIDLTRLDGHARSYQSWHHEGLQVLKVTETRKGLRIQAGVQYSKPQAGREPYDKVFTAAPTTRNVAEINAVIAQATAGGGSVTSQMREHKMQATLVKKPALIGLAQLFREYPAYRGAKTMEPDPPGRPGYIDFLGADADGNLHVVETKIGHDPKVVLQALDYAIWVKANEPAVRATLAKQGHTVPTPTRSRAPTAAAPMHLVLGAGAKGAAFNAYLASQIEALAGDCKVTVHVTGEPTADSLSLTGLTPRDMWTASTLVTRPMTKPRWAGRLTNGLLNR